MKYIKSVISLILIVFLFSGCSMRMASSIDDLISPISPFGDNADVQTAMDNFVKNGYSLKTPNSGEYIASYNFYDIDNDGEEEAFTFYEPSDNLGSIDLAIIKKVNNVWTVVENINGDGKDIYSIDFKDLNGDSKKEILVCWDAISNSSNHVLSVYAYNIKEDVIKLLKIDDSITINNYITVDIDRDNVLELMLFEINISSSSRVKAELYSLKNNMFKLLGETRLDSNITTYTDIKIEDAENDIRIYADGLGADGNSMTTEVIYWSNGYDTIVSPFYSYSSGRTRDTTRNALVVSQDINNDKLIEIPTDKSLKGLPKGVQAIDWKIYKKTTLIHVDYSLLVQDDNYFVTIPNKLINEIKVAYNEKDRLLTVTNKSNKNMIFSIMPVLKATYDKSKYEGYTVILENSGYYYLAKSGNDKDIKITTDDLKTYINSIER